MRECLSLLWRQLLPFLWQEERDPIALRIGETAADIASQADIVRDELFEKIHRSLWTSLFLETMITVFLLLDKPKEAVQINPYNVKE